MSIFWMRKQNRSSNNWVVPVALAIGAILLSPWPVTAQDDLEDLFGPEENLAAGESEDLEERRDLEEEGNSLDLPPFPEEAFRFAPPNFQTFLNPQAGEFYLAGHAFALEGNYIEAINSFSQAISVDARFVDALYEQGLAYAYLGETNQAIQAISAASTYASSSPANTIELNTVLGNLLLEEKYYQEAAAAFGRARQADYIDNDLRLMEGGALIRFGLALQATNPNAAIEIFETAIDSLEEALADDASHAEYYFLRGSALFQLGEIEDALDAMRMAEQLNPAEWKYIQRIGFMELQQGHTEAEKEPGEISDLVIAHYQAAITAFDHYLQANPGDAGDKDLSAEELGDRILPTDIYIGRAAAKIVLAKHLTEGDLYQESLRGAINDCNAALLLDDERASAFLNRGTAERLLKSYDEAIASLTETIRLDPNNGEAYLLRGISWYYLEENELALGDFEISSGLGADPRFLFWSGLVHARAGDFYEAINSYSSVIRVVPNHNMAHVNRGLAYIHTNEGEKAVDDFNHLILLDPQNAKAFFYRGLAHAQLGDSEAAIRSYERALFLDPQLEEAKQQIELLRIDSLSGS